MVQIPRDWRRNPLVEGEKVALPSPLDAQKSLFERLMSDLHKVRTSPLRSLSHSLLRSSVERSLESSHRPHLPSTSALGMLKYRRPPAEEERPPARPQRTHRHRLADAALSFRIGPPDPRSKHRPMGVRGTQERPRHRPWGRLPMLAQRPAPTLLPSPCRCLAYNGGGGDDGSLLPCAFPAAGAGR